MAWELLEADDNVGSMRSELTALESDASVDTIDWVVPHKIGRDRVVLFVLYTEAA